jgi:CO/xanthine dehydrogenase FAD-binding subunit
MTLWVCGFPRCLSLPNVLRGGWDVIREGFDYEKPATVARLFELMKRDGVKVLAGGTDVIPMMREGRLRPWLVVDIKGIEEFKGVYPHGDGLFIGAAEPVEAVAQHPLTCPYTAFVQGAGSLGCPEIRWRATVGGNICNGSPSADCVPGLLVYDADVILVSESGERVTPLESFLLGPGKTDLRPGEVLKGIMLKKPVDGSQSRYYRRTRVKGMDLSGLSAAIYCEGFSGFRIALGAAWPRVARAREAERILAAKPFSKALLAQAIQAILSDISPRANSLRASPDYKRAMIPLLIEMGISDMNGGKLNE